MPTPQDNYGYFGPKYSFADNIALPGDLGVRQEASFGAILDSVAGVNHYLDVIAFGQATGFDKHAQSPMGIRYFMDTGMRCSNGATMSEYFDGVTRGDSLGVTIQRALESAGLPGLKGLAPGMLENAEQALDPRPILSAMTSTGYPVCQQIQCPVGDANGKITNASDGSRYIIDDVQYQGGRPTQTRWVQAYESDGSMKNLTKNEFLATPKCYNADGSYNDKAPAGCAARPAAPSPTGFPSRDRYGLCTRLQPPTAKPTAAQIAAVSSPAAAGGTAQEGFADSDPESAIVAALASTAVVLGVAGSLWYLTQRRR